MSTVSEHRALSPAIVRCAVLTVSDTRTLETDSGGQLCVDLLTGGGHQVVRRDLCPDDPRRIEQLVSQWAEGGNMDAVLVTGGTGISARDQTHEAIAGLLTKRLDGYAELFRMLSYQEIGPAAMLSRALGGVVGRTIVLTMPGSPAAVRLAMEKLIVPELGHLVREAQR